METLLGTSIGPFIGLSLILVGGAAVLTGHALAVNWRSVWQVVAAGIGLGLLDRFLTYALFGGALLHPLGLVIHTLIFIGIAVVTFRVTRAHRMVLQYPWKYERAGLFGWQERRGG
ncbi:DUF6867 family protein [Marinivivus vitaminiproducens]|uniref:DUF6867 family protein n=1 Tax=Marinivivus vitaminiproducens TaxID=3035935 RepID=UPI0027AB31FB|nr:hypothetical protein P4R82_17925 [Geminicoccaceae bacterium SCSIO 64248]